MNERATSHKSGPEESRLKGVAQGCGHHEIFEPASTNLLAEAELAQELSHDLHTRYIDKQLKKAEAEVRKEHAAMRKISGAWSGMGALEVFRGWRKWARREAKRRAKDVFCDATNSSGFCVALSSDGRSTSTRLSVPRRMRRAIDATRVHQNGRPSMLRVRQVRRRVVRRAVLGPSGDGRDGLGRAVGRSVSLCSTAPRHGGKVPGSDWSSKMNELGYRIKDEQAEAKRWS